jgi:hypothetical protein
LLAKKKPCVKISFTETKGNRNVEQAEKAAVRLGSLHTLATEPLLTTIASESWFPRDRCVFRKTNRNFISKTLELTGRAPRARLFKHVLVNWSGDRFFSSLVSLSISSSLWSFMSELILKASCQWRIYLGLGPRCHVCIKIFLLIELLEFQEWLFYSARGKNLVLLIVMNPWHNCWRSLCHWVGFNC